MVPAAVLGLRLALIHSLHFGPKNFYRGITGHAPASDCTVGEGESFERSISVPSNKIHPPCLASNSSEPQFEAAPLQKTTNEKTRQTNRFRFAPKEEKRQTNRKSDKRIGTIEDLG